MVPLYVRREDLLLGNPSYYVGEKAIAERLGLRSLRAVTRLILRYGLPVYPRRRQNYSGKGVHTAYAISESAISAWELARGREFAQKLRTRAEAKQLQADLALARKRADLVRLTKASV